MSTASAVTSRPLPGGVVESFVIDTNWRGIPVPSSAREAKVIASVKSRAVPGTDAATPPGASVNEVQRIVTTGTPTGGTFTLSIFGKTTGTIARNASAATIKTALEAINLFASGGGDISASGGALPTAVDLTFTGNYAGMDLPLMTADYALLSGGTLPTVVVTEQTKGTRYGGAVLQAGTEEIWQLAWYRQGSGSDQDAVIWVKTVSGSGTIDVSFYR